MEGPKSNGRPLLTDAALKVICVKNTLFYSEDGFFGKKEIELWPKMTLQVIVHVQHVAPRRAQWRRRPL